MTLCLKISYKISSITFVFDEKSNYSYNDIVFDDTSLSHVNHLVHSKQSFNYNFISKNTNQYAVAQLQLSEAIVLLKLIYFEFERLSYQFHKQ